MLRYAVIWSLNRIPISDGRVGNSLQSELQMKQLRVQSDKKTAAQLRRFHSEIVHKIRNTLFHTVSCDTFVAIAARLLGFGGVCVMVSAHGVLSQNQSI